MKQKILVLCGPSGAGKDYLEQSLIDERPDLFNKLKQVTTRDPRGEESQDNPYIFVDNPTFEYFKETLIGVVGQESKFGKYYGTLPKLLDDKINTLILSEEGILDLYQSFQDGRLSSDSVDFLIFGIDAIGNIREGRSEELLEKEKEVFEYCDKIFINNHIVGEFVTVDEVIEDLKELKFI